MVNIDLDVFDVLVIYRVLGGNRGGLCFVIVKFCDIDIKIKVIKNCFKDEIKKCFVMYDYLI